MFCLTTRVINCAGNDFDSGIKWTSLAKCLSFALFDSVCVLMLDEYANKISEKRERFSFSQKFELTTAIMHVLDNVCTM